MARLSRRLRNGSSRRNRPTEEAVAPPPAITPSNQYGRPTAQTVAPTSPPTLHNSVIGKAVGIVGHVGGRIVAVMNENVPTGAIITAHTDPDTIFIVEASPVEGSEPMVTFRIDGTRFYLTQNPFGDVARAQLLETLISAESFPFPAEVLREITEFAVGAGTRDGNFEGAGFDYTPMNALHLQEPPGILQSFVLERVGQSVVGLNHIGIRSPFGKYWRSQHWDHTVSQSPHCLGDETWRFSRATSVPTSSV
uniref:Uncharacterized protein n=1 Tax=Amphora coffeiformis TaxID=265554 RepID=A0A7S3L7U1_9STRA|mmetsp:Transcript_1726/g.3766  ORF Transcript_1726/g.3766 Transcript_1726/m.3766 type:complete len:251 (-) Transcript_1726:109-861(-)|eukprot:scaffold34674_cov171-Amphora_coffeaeformis.AAC.6